MDTRTHGLLNIMLIIPEKFIDVLIWASDEIENFDIGFESFYLVVRKDIEIQGWEFADFPDRVAERMRQKYFVYTNRPELGDEYRIKFFDRTLISKPVSIFREVDNDPQSSYGWKIWQGMKTWPQDSERDSFRGIEEKDKFHCASIWQWIDGINLGDKI